LSKSALQTGVEIGYTGVFTMKQIDFTTIKHLYVVGSVAYDEIMDFPGRFADYIQPEKVHQLSLSFVIDRLTKQLGGIATNISYGLRLVSEVHASPIGGVGQDSRDFLTFFKHHNIDTSLLVQDKALYCATGKVITDMHNNQIWSFYYGACERGKDVSFEHIDPHSSFVVISSTHADAFVHAQNECIKRNIPYMYDPGMALSVLSEQVLRSGIQHAHIVIGNDYEMGMITEKTSISVTQMVQDGKTVITTLGEQGVRHQHGSNTVEVGVVPGLNVIDPTGAGDNFRGGYLGALVEGADIEEALKIGAATASYAIESYGTTNHRPKKAQIQARAKTIVGNSYSSEL
jgi:adenosine kinase